jgi:hypothetical protein
MVSPTAVPENTGMDVSMVCPRCGCTRRGERFRVDENAFTICYCSSCGPSWTRDDAPEQRPLRAKAVAGPRRPRQPAASKIAS